MQTKLRNISNIADKSISHREDELHPKEHLNDFYAFKTIQDLHALWCICPTQG